MYWLYILCKFWMDQWCLMWSIAFSPFYSSRNHFSTMLNENQINRRRSFACHQLSTVIICENQQIHAGSFSFCLLATSDLPSCHETALRHVYFNGGCHEDLWGWRSGEAECWEQEEDVIAPVRLQQCLEAMTPSWQRLSISVSPPARFWCN